MTDNLVMVDFRYEHGLDILRTRGREAEKRFLSMLDLEDRLEEKEKTGNAWTMLKDGRPIACGGFYRYTDEGAEAWYMMTPEAWAERRILFRVVRNIITNFLRLHPCRLTGHILDDDEAGKTWARHLGFRETETRITADDRVYVLYERVAA